MNEPQPPGDIAPAPCVYEVRTFRDHIGHNITEHILVSGESLPPDLSRFMGQIFITLQAGNGPMQQVPVPLFAIGADTIERAFDMFEGLATAAGTTFKETLMAQQKRIQTVTPAQASRLMGPDGKFLTPP